MPAKSRRLNIDPDAMRRHASDAAQLLKALANEKRLQILCLLAEGERSVGEINALLDLSQSALSQHLAVLREEGLVGTRRDAQNVFYALAPGPAFDIIHTLHGIYCSPAHLRAGAAGRHK
ncbi:ArsR/SmtB family transcription factor [Pseudoxanthomonas mexicana]|uniref:ArsR/SmtB family transcription factor n=1 Tax=Pseudoxanthomonas mexicana TaxID=128785 RepID=UPI00398B057A